MFLQSAKVSKLFLIAVSVVAGIFFVLSHINSSAQENTPTEIEATQPATESDPETVETNTETQKEKTPATSEEETSATSATEEIFLEDSSPFDGEPLPETAEEQQATEDIAPPDEASETSDNEATENEPRAEEPATEPATETETPQEEVKVGDVIVSPSPLPESETPDPGDPDEKEVTIDDILNPSPESEISKEEEKEEKKEKERKPTIDEILDPTAEPKVLFVEPEELLKKRNIEREVILEKNAPHSCRAVEFNLDISDQSEAVALFALEGERGRTAKEDMEVGNLPEGIDMTFINNNDYSYAPGKDEDLISFQITNQPGSQKGNFNVPIIYTIAGKTIICQINIINF